MLKKRLVPCMILRDNVLVQSIGFKNYFPIGRPKFTIERFVDWDVDEIIFVDISATPENRCINLEIVSELAKKCFVPLTVGGGIRTIQDIRNILKAGADKIIINSIAVNDPHFITQAANMFGSQCIVVSIDAKEREDGTYEAVTNCGKKPTGKTVIEWAKEAERYGSGEIFLNSIDQDGKREGYDLKLIKSVADVVDIPVIACGGVGDMGDFTKGVQEGQASAVSASNIFQHSEHSTIKAKAAMKKAGVDVRISIAATYLAGNKLEKLELSRSGLT